MKVIRINHRYLVGALAFCLISCGSQNGGNTASNKSVVGAQLGFENRWTKGMPEIRGQVPELHLRVSRQGIYDPEHVGKGDGGWIRLLDQAKGMNPKPLLILSADRNLDLGLRRAALERLGKAYECQAYKCFVTEQDGSKGTNAR